MYRLLGVCFGAALAALLLLWQDGVRRQPFLSLLPENEGAIQSVEIQYTAEGAPSARPALAAFVEALPPAVEVVGVCGTAADAAAWNRDMQPLRPNGSTKCITIGQPITAWAKDRFLVTEGNPRKLVFPKYVQPGGPGRANDSQVAPALAKNFPTRYKAEAIPLNFDAGDILAGSDGIFVSDSLWEKNERRQDFLSVLHRHFGREVVWLHGVPDHHIGMFAAPIGDRTVLVGSPELGMKLWRGTPPGFDSPVTAGGQHEPFRQAQRELRKAGYRVVPLPLVPVAPKVYITYTNGVFETRGRNKVVYMPSYGIPEMDNAARKIFEAEGWTVHPIPVQSVYQHRGTIGCLVNVLERR